MILLNLFVINLLNSLNVTKIVDIVVRTCAIKTGLLTAFFPQQHQKSKAKNILKLILS